MNFILNKENNIVQVFKNKLTRKNVLSKKDEDFDDLY